jgi:hypothetical protein
MSHSNGSDTYHTGCGNGAAARVCVCVLAVSPRTSPPSQSSVIYPQCVALFLRDSGR